MKRITLFVCALAFFASSETRADIVSDRVLLVTGASGCPSGSTGFRRLKQNLDGTQVLETAEFTPPTGSYFEITNLEYTLPYYTPWASYYQQYVDFVIRPRAGGNGTNILPLRFGNKQVFTENENYQMVSVGDIVSSG